MRIQWGVVLVVLAGCGGPDAERDARPDADGVAERGVAFPPPRAAAARPAEGRGTLVFLGTSLTAAYGLDPEDGFPAHIRARIDSAGLPFDVVALGSSGETTAGALQRIDWVLQSPMEFLVLETGANDGLRGLRVDSTRANIEALIARIRGRHPATQIFLVQMEAPPNLGESYTSAYRAMFPRIAAEHGVTLVPFLLEGVAGVDTLNLADGIHPNALGQRRVAENVWRVLEPVLRARGASGG